MIRCSDLARTLAEPLAGTAPLARAWVALEQPGPWGPKALLSSHLPPTVGERLSEATADLPVTAVLVRRVGHHADDHVVERPRQVWLAWTGPGPWLVHAVVDDPADVLALDLGALAEGRRPEGFGADDPERLLLVCTNAKRDQCCAIIGRPVAADLSARHPGRVWESSHLGGHRFAPTILSLPDGFVYGGAGAASLETASSRGRSFLPRAAQAAELAVLTAASARHPHALDVRAADGRWSVADPAAPAGPPVLVAVTERPLEPPRAESCGKDPVASTAWTAHVLAP